MDIRVPCSPKGTPMQWQWFRRWRSYEAKVWRRTWQETRAAARKIVSSGAGIAALIVLAFVLVGASAELLSFLPLLLIAAVLFLGALFVNRALTPSRLDQEASDALAAEKGETAGLREQISRKRVLREQYAALRRLFDDGEALTISRGIPTWENWSERVVAWRTSVHDHLPFERERFLSIASPQMFEATRDEERHVLLVAQMEELRKILIRVEHEVDRWDPGV